MNTNTGTDAYAQAKCITCGNVVHAELWLSSLGKYKVETAPHDSRHKIRITLSYSEPR